MKEYFMDGIVFHSENQCRNRKHGYLEQSYSVFLYVLPFVLSLLCYSNILTGDFVHDDVFAIEKNPDVTCESNLMDIWLHDYWGQPIASVKSHKSYRPLTVLLFRLDYYLSQGCSTWFHTVNMCLHACVTCTMAYVCTHVLHTSVVGALLASSIFAVHPVHTEAVSGIVGRADVLAALFFLLSFTAYARSVKMQDTLTTDKNANEISSRFPTLSQSLPLLLALLLAVVASLCKETGFTVIGVCFLYDLIQHGHQLLGIKSEKPKHINALCMRLLVLMVTAILFLGFRFYIMDFQQPSFTHEDNPASFSESFLVRVLTFNYLLPFNLWLLICPCVLCYDWQVGSIPLLESVQDHRNAFTLAFYITALCLAVKCWRQFYLKTKGDSQNTETIRSRVQILPMALVLLCVPFVPASNLFFRVGFVVAERVLYIPSIGFCILVSQGIIRLYHFRPKFKLLIMILTALLIVTLAGKTWRRNPVWASRKTLFRSGLQTMPSNAKMHFNIGNLYRDTGEYPLAIEHYRTAIGLYPHHPSYHNNLGSILANQNESEYHYRRALELSPTHKKALVNLGNVMISQGNTMGLHLIDKALEIDPLFYEAHLSMGKALLSDNKFKEAEGFIQQAIQLKPDLPDAHTYYGYLFQQTGKLEHAVNEYQHAFTLNSHNTMAMKNAAISLQGLQRYSEAEVLLKRALSVQGDSEIYSQLGELYAEMGQKVNARSAYRDALSLSPNNTVINLRYIKVLVESNEHRDVNQSLSSLLARVPNDLHVLRFAYTYKQMTGMVEEAFFYLEEAINQAKLMNHESLGKLYHDKADIYRQWSDFDNSLKFLDLSVQVDPTLVESYINIGTIHHLRGNYSQAEEFYLKALSLNPVNQLARKNMDKLKSVCKNCVVNKR